MAYYERNLPHWHPEGHPLFITWRLHGSLPKEVLQAIKNDRKNKKRTSAGKTFRNADRLLDRAQSGPLWLKDPRIANCVVDSLRRGDAELNHYRLHAFVVMANHVHALLTPLVAVRRITNGIKGVTSREANRILRRTGQPFWQVESYDHWVRSDAQFERIRAYIENNPVHAGLVARPQDWPWSSAYKK
ncbi:MAG: transposase [Acidobacteria bacterium]|nr:transposase [Acidobacteriota bacterium]